MQLKISIPDNAVIGISKFPPKGVRLQPDQHIWQGEAKDFNRARTGIENGDYYLTINHPEVVPVLAPVTLTGGRLTFPDVNK